MKNFFIIVFGLLIGAVIILAIVSFVKPATITTNKVPTQTTNTTPSQPKAPQAQTPTNPTPSTPAPQTPAPTPVKTSPLVGKTWHWVNNTFSNGGVVTARDSSRFALTFKTDGTFSSSTDCNGIGGKYTTDGTSITFSDMMSTLMYCPGSQEAEYRKVFEQSQTYIILKNGGLRIDVKYGAGYGLFN